MPAIKVYSLMSYPSWDFREVSWRDMDHKAFFFVHAVKDDKKKIGSKAKSFNIGANNTPVLLTRNNLHLAQNYYAAWVARGLRQLGVGDPVIVPIPNRNALVGSTDFNTARLTRSVAAAYGNGARAAPVLRFREFVPKERGSRQSVGELVDNLVMTDPLPAGTVVVLDDVFTLGRHIMAASQVLSAVRPPTVGFTAGRTVKAPLAKMFSATISDLQY